MSFFKGCVICHPNEKLLPGEQIGIVCPTCRRHAEIGRRVMLIPSASEREFENEDRYRAQGFNACLKIAKGEPQ